MPARHVFFVSPLTDSIAFRGVLATRSEVGFRELTAATPAHEAASVLALAHVYQVGSVRDELPPPFQVNDALFMRTPNLLLVSTHGAGYDSVDVDACTRAGVLAVNQAGGNAEAVAEHVLAMMLCLTKRIGETDRFMRRQDHITRVEYMGRNILGKTIGIVGLGHVGTRVAELCNGLFKMRVIAYDPLLTDDEIRRRGAQSADLDSVLRHSDYVSVNCPLTARTRGLIGAREYALMPKHAYFINTARGGIHDEAALVDALRDQRIAGAGLDVWDLEPPPASHPLMQFDNVLVSPHTAGVTVESRKNIATIAAQQLLDVLDGKQPPRLLNPEVWPAYAKRFERILGFPPTT